MNFLRVYLTMTSISSSHLSLLDFISVDPSRAIQSSDYKYLAGRQHSDTDEPDRASIVVVETYRLIGWSVPSRRNASRSKRPSYWLLGFT